MAHTRSPKDRGEEMPGFFTNARYKLMYKVMQDHKNCKRLGRKPLPAELKKKIAEQSKEYHAYKVVEKDNLERELNAQTKVQLKAMDAICFLPDYLMEECLEENSEKLTLDMMEFEPSTLYMEQLLRLYPREITARWRLQPAFEESFMRIEDGRKEGL